MKKITAFILAFILIFSSASVFASAAHTHQPGNYVDIANSEYGHSYFCKLCGELVTEEHKTNEAGECECGYKDHIHWARTYPAYTDTLHTFTCEDCGVTIIDNHQLDINGECFCGYVEHEHVARVYTAINLGETHSFTCKYCGATITESHKIDEEGKCPCGYEEHEHTPDTYGMTDYAHLYWCTDCYSIITEKHTFNEKGRCVCGYADSNTANPIVVMFQPITMAFSMFKLYMSSYIMGIKLGFDMYF